MDTVETPTAASREGEYDKEKLQQQSHRQGNFINNVDLPDLHFDDGEKANLKRLLYVSLLLLRCALV